MANKEKVIKKLQYALEDAEEDGKIYAEIRRPVLFDVIALLKEQEEVVRCKDCKYGRMINMLNYTCTESQNHCEHVLHSQDWFCADGKRR